MHSSTPPTRFLSTPPSRVATLTFLRMLRRQSKFLSTPPSRVATEISVIAAVQRRVSIHATLAGGDGLRWGAPAGSPRFYPRHPRGWRRSRRYRRLRLKGFLSTPPSRVATSSTAARSHIVQVSIHATLAGGDIVEFSIMRIDKAFLSTPPPRVATPGLGYPQQTAEFLSTPPPRVATRDRGNARLRRYCFYPRHPRGWRRVGFDGIRRGSFVSIHATLAGGDKRVRLKVCEH